ncbi:MAG: hypothetical protein ACXWU5_05375 [Rhodoplanes sp.]|nr:hypothetical protein [Rhodoplanes sp.]
MGRVPLPAVCDGDTVELQSKAGKPLTRYFPELMVAARTLGAKTPAMMIVFDLLITPTAAFASTRLMRFRPDKTPAQCTMDQVEQRANGLVKLLD